MSVVALIRGFPYVSAVSGSCVIHSVSTLLR